MQCFLATKDLNNLGLCATFNLSHRRTALLHHPSMELFCRHVYLQAKKHLIFLRRRTGEAPQILYLAAVITPLAFWSHSTLFFPHSEIGPASFPPFCARSHYKRFYRPVNQSAVEPADFILTACCVFSFFFVLIFPVLSNALTAIICSPPYSGIVLSWVNKGLCCVSI